MKNVTGRKFDKLKRSESYNESNAMFNVTVDGRKVPKSKNWCGLGDESDERRRQMCPNEGGRNLEGMGRTWITPSLGLSSLVTTLTSCASVCTSWLSSFCLDIFPFFYVCALPSALIMLSYGQIYDCNSWFFWYKNAVIQLQIYDIGSFLTLYSLSIYFKFYFISFYVWFIFCFIFFLYLSKTY